MTTHNTAAASAVETLTPLLQEAAQAAQDKRQAALDQVATEVIRQRLLDALAAAESKPDAALLQQFTAMLPQELIILPNQLPAALLSLFYRKRMHEEHAIKVAQTLLAVIRGELSAGLIILDANWHRNLRNAALERFLGWVDPAALEEIQLDCSRAALDFASASYEAGRIEQMQAGLELLTVKPYKAQATVKVCNHAGNTHGARTPIGVIEIGPDEPAALERLQLAELMRNPGIMGLFDTGVLEVLR